MPRKIEIALSIFILALSAGIEIKAQTAPRLVLKPCRLQYIEEEARCGTYEVFEDRAAKRGRKISLRVAVLPALAPDTAPDPIFYLSGGPGSGAVGQAGSAAFLLEKARRDREIVLVDQRGTGASNPLKCGVPARSNLQRYLSDLMSPETAGECRKELEKRADLTLYTTPIAMDDLDEVREALGYERINLFGGSYGTRAALVYLRQYPARTRSVVLMGAVPTYFDMPFSYARDSEAAMARLLSDCSADKSCGEAFPNIKDEFQKVLATLAKGPVKVTLRDPATGKPEEVEFSYDVAVERLRFLLYSGNTSRQIPLLIHKAAQGDFAPLAGVAASTGALLYELIYTGMFFSVTCAEDVPFIDQKKVPQEIANTFLRDVRMRAQLRACRDWPRASLPEGYRNPVRSNAPVLILSGAVDPVTPARWGEEVARYLPNSLHAINPSGGHSDFGDCAANLVGDFIKRASVKELDPSCMNRQCRPPFVTQ